MATLDKEIRVLALKGEKGNSAYQDAVENELFSGTLEEFISTFATPENYITRYEYRKVTQAEYDALEQAGQLINDCYYIITDDDTWDTIQGLLGLESVVDGLVTDVSNIDDRLSQAEENIGVATTELDNAIENIETLQSEMAETQQTVGDMQSDILHIQTKSSIPTILNCPTTSENKVVTADFPVPIAEGTEIYVKFAIYGSTNVWHIMTLNVNNTGGLPICVFGTFITPTDTPVWQAGNIVRLICEWKDDSSEYVWNVLENITKHIYCGNFFNR